MSDGINIKLQPPEISITMQDTFIHGATAATITITNTNNQSINITWYLEHPTPISLMRPNRTYIENLSWIQVHPSWQLVGPQETASFSIGLDIPERDDLRNQHWETWITFTPKALHGGDGSFLQEYAVRVYIDTPRATQQSGGSDQGSLFLLLAVVIAIATVSIILYLYKKKSAN
jgi:hypothetical protein